MGGCGDQLCTSVLVIVLDRSSCTGDTAQLAGEIGAVRRLRRRKRGGHSSRKSFIALGVMPAAIAAAVLWALLMATYLPTTPGCYND